MRFGLGLLFRLADGIIWRFKIKIKCLVRGFGI